MTQIISTQLLNDIRELLTHARQTLVQTVNTAMVQTYWHVGRLIVEHEQKGQARAEYGKQVLEQLAQNLTTEFGKGFDASNLRNMRRFYMAYPIQETLSLKLSWSHYCKIIRIENPSARDWYANECINNQWSVRALERQISKLYYERLLASNDQAPVIKEAEDKTSTLQTDIKQYLRDPYILDFLNLPSPQPCRAGKHHRTGLNRQLATILIRIRARFCLCLTPTTLKRRRPGFLPGPGVL